MQVYDSGNIVGKAEKEFYNMKNYTGKSELGKEDFLTLLVAQLQHQDPLNPMDDKQFTSQLAQFSQLEQLTAINEGIGTLSENTMQQDMTSAASFIGRNVRAVGDGLSVREDGTVSTLYYLTADTAKKVYINIFDEGGNIIRTVNLGAQAEGEHEFQWDGKDWAGKEVPMGQYRVAMAAEGEEGDPIMIQTEVSGKVEGAVYSGGQHYLRLDDGRVVAFNYVKEVVAPSQGGDASDEGGAGSEESTE